ncbi:hypothetical protein V8E36_006706 [Tilletia maclaganii]
MKGNARARSSRSRSSSNGDGSAGKHRGPKSGARWTSSHLVLATAAAAGLLALGPTLLLLLFNSSPADAGSQSLLSKFNAVLKGEARALEQGGSDAGGSGSGFEVEVDSQEEAGLAALFSDLRPRPTLHRDPLKTTRCDDNAGVKDAHGRQRPLVQYALMIDAGSTGSRIHIYKFNNCGASPELENDFFELVKGGLSAPAYSASAELAADSLRPLLDLARRQVPESLWSCTPISVKATAGLRLLGPKKAEAILEAVRRLLEHQYPFPIADGSEGRGVEIMDGREEGVFAFITINYLLNRLGDQPHFSSDLVGRPSRRPHTAAVLDLGGGSTQIVFEPRFEHVSKVVQEEAKHVGMHPGEHVYELKNFGSQSHTLYQNSYLGYGLMQARATVNALTLHAFLLSHPLGAAPRAAVRRSKSVPTESSASAAATDTSRDEPQLEPVPAWSKMNEHNTHVPSPCYGPRGKREIVRLEQVGALGSADSQSELDQRRSALGGSASAWSWRGGGGRKKARASINEVPEPSSSSRNVTFLGGGGGFEACRRYVEIMMDKDAACTLPPCSFAGVYQPPLVSTFQDSPIIALSYFYDRLVPLLGTAHEYRRRHVPPSGDGNTTAEAQPANGEPVEEHGASFTVQTLRDLAVKVCAGPVRRSNVSDADIEAAYADFFEDELQASEAGSNPAAATPDGGIVTAERRLADLDASLWTWDPIFPPATHPRASAELFHRPESCLDLTYMHALLSHGYELPAKRELVLAKKLGGVELGWCLGAQLAVLEDEGLRCRASKGA